MRALILFLFVLLSLSSPAQADVSVPRAKQYLWTVFDASVMNGVSVPGAQNIIYTGGVVPAGAVITDFWIYINQQFVTQVTGTESLAVGCQGNQDLMNFTTLKNIPADRILVSRMLGNTFNGSAPLLPASPTILNFSQGYGTVPYIGSSISTGCPVYVEIQGGAGNTGYNSGKFTAVVEFFKL